MKAAASSRFLSHAGGAQSVLETVTPLLQQIPNVITVSISSKGKVPSFLTLPFPFFLSSLHLLFFLSFFLSFWILEELEAFALPENGHFLFVNVNLPNDVTEADLWIQQITNTVAQYGRQLSIFAVAPKADVITVRFILLLRFALHFSFFFSFMFFLLSLSWLSQQFTTRTSQKSQKSRRSDIQVNPYLESGDLFEVYSFFSAGVWMGIIATVLILFILVPALMCLTDLQTHTKFEKST